MTATDTHRAIEAVFRIEQAKLIAGLARMVRDIGLAEELAQDALVAALEQWPKSGIPDNPGAWLMAAAKHRAIDVFRRNSLRDRKHQQLGYELEIEQETAQPDLDAALDDQLGDDLLRLIFIACHPILSSEARAALTLRLIGGLTTEEIARAFLVPEPTIQQRIVRAKRTLSDSRVPFEVPRGNELEARLVLGALGHLLDLQRRLFGHRRRGLDAASAQHGGVASRPHPGRTRAGGGRGARSRGADGDPGFALRGAHRPVGRAGAAARSGPRALGSASHPPRSCGVGPGGGLNAAPDRTPGPYALQAAIAACHARARRAEDTDWARIVGLYAKLGEVTPSPVVELNRAVALAMLFGPEAGLNLVDALTTEPALKTYHLLPSVRGDLLWKLGRLDEARAEFERAATLTQNERERTLLLGRAAACAVKPTRS